MDRTKIKGEIIPFVVQVKKKYSPEKIILFGSRAKNTYWKNSDYDFIIVSSKFKNVHWLKRISGLVKLWELPTDVDILPYTPQEFEKKKKLSSIVREAIKQGVVIS